MPVVEHIERHPDRCGGKPCISGTRIRVWDIHVWHDLRGQTPAEIVAAFPQITVADVHAALAYYLDHRDEIERQMEDADEQVRRIQAASGPSLLSRIRAEEADDDSVSS